jgi:hypothetical protein
LSSENYEGVRKIDSTDIYLFGDSGHWGFLLKGTLSWILLQTFCHQPRPKYYNFIKILEGAANPCISCWEADVQDTKMDTYMDMDADMDTEAHMDNFQVVTNLQHK